MYRLCISLALLVSVLAGFSGPVAAAVHAPVSAAQFATVDIVFESKSVYSAWSPFTNPFTEVNLALDVRSPSGVRRRIAGFFDGDGRGGSRGGVFRVRLGPDEAGTWTWKAHSNLVEFDGRGGQIEVTGTLAGRFGRGPLRVTRERPARFAHADGTRIFLLGKFLDEDQPPPLRFSHTFFADRMTDSGRERLFAHQRSLGVNKINLYLANVGDYGGSAVTPWVGHWRLLWRNRFDLAFWKRVDDWVGRLREAGIAAHLWFFADDSDFGRMAPAERDLLVRYAMARLSAYPNTLFTVALEWQEAFSAEEIRHLGEQTQAANPWGRLVSAHSLDDRPNRPHNASLADEPWLDFLDVQTGFVDAQTLRDVGLRYRGLAGKPMLLEEFSRGGLNDAERVKTWAALMTAPAGIGTGTGIRAIANLLAEVDLADLEPAPDLVHSGHAWAIAGSEYAVVYVYGPGALRLTKRAGRYTRARWFDPREGRFAAGEFMLVPDREWTPPDERDWALVLDRQRD